MAILYCLFLFLSAALHGVLGIANPACNRNDVPILGVTDATAEKKDDVTICSVHVEHSFPVDVSWVRVPNGIQDYYNLYYIEKNLSQLTSMMTRTGITVSEARLNAPPLITNHSSSSFFGVIIQVISGPYDVRVSVGSHNHNTELSGRLEGLSRLVMDAPKKETAVEEGQQITFSMLASEETYTGGVFTAVSKKTKSGYKFNNDFEMLQRMTDFGSFEGTGDYEGVTFFNGAEMGLGMTINSFDGNLHSGYYCFMLAGDLGPSSITFNLQACFELKRAQQSKAIKKEVFMETCSWPAQNALEDTAPLYLGESDCITCSSFGFNQGHLYMIKGSETVPAELLPSNSASVSQLVYTIPKVDKSTEGKYICVALDDDDIEKKVMETRAVERMRVNSESMSINRGLGAQCTVNRTDVAVTFKLETLTESYESVFSPLEQGDYPCYNVTITRENIHEHDVTTWSIIADESDDMPECDNSISYGMDQYTYDTVYCQVESELQTVRKMMFSLHYSLDECCKYTHYDYWNNYDNGY